MKTFVYALLMLVLVGFGAGVQAQDEGERTIFDKDGEARAYLAKDNTIYLFTGESAAYMTSSRQSGFKSIFGMNGEHMGWFVDGIFFNHQQKVVGFFDQAPNVSVQASLIIPEKYPKQRGFRRMTRPEPLRIVNKPFGIYRWASLEAFLRSGMRY
ncbi:4-fold beta flower protein [uncultured Microscilla sp.]|uniref:4-fold beta flower protein n=1 Tax=uncultured Microscilla sp. TaxID=432653 RepID=UPI00261DC399|nr:hypothetical protein [uncultured Microscilla sp.]